MPCVARLWDTYLASPKQSCFALHPYVCLGMLVVGKKGTILVAVKEEKKKIKKN